MPTIPEDLLPKEEGWNISGTKLDADLSQGEMCGTRVVWHHCTSATTKW